MSTPTSEGTSERSATWHIASTIGDQGALYWVERPSFAGRQVISHFAIVDGEMDDLTFFVGSICRDMGRVIYKTASDRGQFAIGHDFTIEDINLRIQEKITEHSPGEDDYQLIAL